MFIILVKNWFYGYQIQLLDRKRTSLSTSRKCFMANRSIEEGDLEG
jgi:hypothetical protein